MYVHKVFLYRSILVVRPLWLPPPLNVHIPVYSAHAPCLPILAAPVYPLWVPPPHSMFIYSAHPYLLWLPPSMLIYSAHVYLL